MTNVIICLINFLWLCIWCFIQSYSIIARSRLSQLLLNHPKQWICYNIFFPVSTKKQNVAHLNGHSMFPWESYLKHTSAKVSWVPGNCVVLSCFYTYKDFYVIVIPSGLTSQNFRYGQHFLKISKEKMLYRKTSVVTHH